MIKFVSVEYVSMTTIDGCKNIIGRQVGIIADGITPTYGMTANDMQINEIVITFTWRD